jgi:hypothetical protein
MCPCLIVRSFTRLPRTATYREQGEHYAGAKTVLWIPIKSSLPYIICMTNFSASCAMRAFLKKFYRLESWNRSLAQFLDEQEAKQKWPVLRIRDVYPRSRILIFTHPGSKNSNKREGWKKIDVIPFYIATNCTKLYIILVLQVLKKKIWANFQRIIELFAQKIVTKLSKVWGWDPGSGKNLFRILDPGVKKAPDPGSVTLKVTTLLSDCDDITPIVQYARID